MTTLIRWLKRGKMEASDIASEFARHVCMSTVIPGKGGEMRQKLK